MLQTSKQTLGKEKARTKKVFQEGLDGQKAKKILNLERKRKRKT